MISTTARPTDEQIARIMADLDRLREAEHTRNLELVTLADGLIAAGGPFVDALREEARRTVAGTVAPEYIADAVEDRVFHLIRRMLDDALPA